jgi:serine/threonine protein kinase
MAGLGSVRDFRPPKGPDAPVSLIGGRYKPLCELGKGAFSSVLLAEDIVRGEKVAVKRLRDSLAGSENVRRMLQLEGKALSLFDNERIVRLLGSGDDFLVLERLEGHASSEYHHGQKAILALASEACEALCTVHQRGIVHRDLKPGHLMIVHGGIKLIDFGYARIPGEWDYSKVAGHDIGTPRYMSPELTRNAWEIDRRSDIYSLGVILYERLSGSPPFEDEDPKRVMSMHRYDEPEPLPGDIHPAVRGIVRKAMAKKPEDRFQDATEMMRAISAAARLL